ncbi:MAG: tetratricopeptide repeat protein [Candidatus Margulisiibacteriota bacterium]|jgi:tetratricopeptide (TPR) repeat protein
MAIGKTSFSLNQLIKEKFGEQRTDRARLRHLPTTRLWDIALDRRADEPVKGRENPVIAGTLKALRRSGLEDPFEIAPKIKAKTKMIFTKNNGRTASPLEQAILLLRAVIPEQNSFVFDQTRYFGLRSDQGGLNIPYDDRPELPMRKKYGNLLPKELLSLPPEKRSAICLEYSFLLTVFLRAAGIKAQVKEIDVHAYVIATIAGKNYKLDAVESIFEETSESPTPDRLSIATHYCFKGDAFSLTKNNIEALACYNHALELAPFLTEIWYAQGVVLTKLGRTAEAQVCFAKAKQ